MKIIPTNIDTLDNLIGGGFYKRRLTSIVGLPENGKTLLLSHIINNLKCPVLHWVIGHPEPTYILVEKLDYTFSLVPDMYKMIDQIADKLMGGFEGVIAVDCICKAQFKNPMEIQSFNRHISGFLRMIMKRWHEMELDNQEVPSVHFLFTLNQQQSSLSERQMTYIGSAFSREICYLSSLILETNIEENILTVCSRKNKMYPPDNKEIKFKIIENGSLESI